MYRKFVEREHFAPVFVIDRVYGKKWILGYQKSSVTCFLERIQGLYRKSLPKIPENLKIGVLRIINPYRPQIRKISLKIEKIGVW